MRYLFYSSVFLIVYGSLYPFDFSLSALGGNAVDRFLYEWSLFSSRGDQLGNIGLFIPYGFLGILCLGNRRNPVGAILALTIFGLVVALWLQVMQLVLPSRDAAIGDVVWNLAGVAIGMLLAWPKRVRQAVLQQSVGQPHLAVILFLGCWLIVELAPFVPSIDFQSFKNSLKPLWQEASFSILAFLRAAAAWTMIGYIAVRTLSPGAALPLFALAMCGTLLAKIVIVDNAITLADVAAVAVAFFGARSLQALGARGSVFLLWFIAGYLFVAGLSPFGFHGAQEFHWLPFAGSLGGSMLLNLKALAAKVFFIGALIYLALDCGFRLKRVVTGLAAGLLALEIAQVWIGSHTPEITDPVLAFVVGAGFFAFRNRESSPAPSGAVETPQEEHAAAPENDSAPGSGILDRSWLYPGVANTIVLALATLVFAIAMQTMLGLPKVPYNVRELFGGQDSWWRLGFFALAVFSFGIGGTVAGHRAARSQVPWVTLPVYAIFACCFTYILLAACVTSESLSDIAGSSNTYFFVMQKGMWGDTGIWLYTLIGSQSLIATVERVVRFIALLGPVFIWLAIFSAVYFRVTGPRFIRPAARARIMLSSLIVYLLSGALWLIAFRLIAFRYSSTDNLNELVQKNGAFLYILLLLLLLNVIAVVHVSLSPKLRNVLGAAFIVLASLPVGWLLFQSGLSAPVEKYGITFRGADFLLGPDRREILPENVLMARWGAVQLAAVATLAFGMRIVLGSRRGASR